MNKLKIGGKSETIRKGPRNAIKLGGGGGKRGKRNGVKKRGWGILKDEHMVKISRENVYNLLLIVKFFVFVDL